MYFVYSFPFFANNLFQKKIRSAKRERICFFKTCLSLVFFSPFSFFANDFSKRIEELQREELHRMVSRRSCAVGEVLWKCDCFLSLWKTLEKTENSGWEKRHEKIKKIIGDYDVFLRNEMHFSFTSIYLFFQEINSTENKISYLQLILHICLERLYSL